LISKYTQSCNAWAVKSGGQATACGTLSRYDADEDDVCDVQGRFCKSVCCDSKDADDILGDLAQDIQKTQQPNNTQLCFAWATTKSGEVTACGATAKYDADDNDVCDKAGKFCKIFCCDFNDEKSKTDALLSAFNTTIANAKKLVQACDQWAAKAGGATMACGALEYSAESDDFCDVQGRFCTDICCDNN
jgi:hypothetical protein